MARIDELLADYQPFHSTLQMRAFITARSGLGSTWGMYCQALRELKKRHDDLRMMDVSRRRTKVNIAELKGWRRRLLDWITGRGGLTVLKLEELESSLIEGVMVERDVRREYAEFFRQADTLKAQLGRITPELRDTLDREQWVRSLRASAMMELISTGQVGGNTLEFLAAAPVDLRIEVLTSLRNIGMDGEDMQSLNAQLDVMGGGRALPDGNNNHAAPRLTERM